MAVVLAFELLFFRVCFGVFSLGFCSGLGKLFYYSAVGMVLILTCMLMVKEIDWLDLTLCCL